MEAEVALPSQMPPVYVVSCLGGRMKDAASFTVKDCLNCRGIQR